MIRVDFQLTGSTTESEYRRTDETSRTPTHSLLCRRCYDRDVGMQDTPPPYYRPAVTQCHQGDDPHHHV